MPESTDEATRIAAIQARVNAATEGPWAWSGDSFVDAPERCDHGSEWCDHGPDLDTVAQDGSVLSSKTVIGSYGHDANGILVASADANFIANARADIPWLLTQLSAAYAELEKQATA